METKVRLKKIEVLQAIELWKEAPVATEVDTYYAKRMLKAIKELLELVPDYTKGMKSTMVSQLEQRIKEDLGKES